MLIFFPFDYFGISHHLYNDMGMLQNLFFSSVCFVWRSDYWSWCVFHFKERCLDIHTCIMLLYVDLVYNQWEKKKCGCLEMTSWLHSDCVITFLFFCCISLLVSFCQGYKWTIFSLELFGSVCDYLNLLFFLWCKIECRVHV